MTWVIAIVGAFMLLASNLIKAADAKADDMNYWNNNGGYQYTDLNG